MSDFWVNEDARQTEAGNPTYGTMTPDEYDNRLDRKDLERELVEARAELADEKKTCAQWHENYKKTLAAIDRVRELRGDILHARQHGEPGAYQEGWVAGIELALAALDGGAE